MVYYAAIHSFREKYDDLSSWRLSHLNSQLGKLWYGCLSVSSIQGDIYYFTSPDTCAEARYPSTFGWLALSARYLQYHIFARHLQYHLYFRCLKHHISPRFVQPHLPARYLWPHQPSRYLKFCQTWQVSTVLPYLPGIFSTISLRGIAHGRRQTATPDLSSPGQ